MEQTKGMQTAITTHFVVRPPDISGPLLISVTRPPTVMGRAASGPFPCVIVTDGDLLFPIAAGVSQLLQIGGDVGPHVVVGVSYAGEIDIDEWTRRRLRDLTPHPIETYPFGEHRGRLDVEPG